MRLFWRTKPAADEHIDVTDSSRRIAIREAEFQAYANQLSSILRISGKPQPKGRTITAPVDPGPPETEAEAEEPTRE